MSVPELVDYDLPTAGAFHNCVIVSIRKRFPGHARKVMHAVWGLGLLSLAKAVVVVDEHVDVHDYEEVFFRVCANVDPKRDVVLADGPIDQLDHASVLPCFGGKIGFDATAKGPDEGAREWPPEIEMTPEVQGAGRRAVGRARVARARRRRNRAEWPRRQRGVARAAGRSAVDTRQGGTVESGTEARSHRVSDEQPDTTARPGAEPLADRLRDRRRMHPRRSRRERSRAHRRRADRARLRLPLGARPVLDASGRRRRLPARPRRHGAARRRHGGRRRHLRRPRDVPLARDDRRRRPDRRRRHASGARLRRAAVVHGRGRRDVRRRPRADLELPARAST